MSATVAAVTRKPCRLASILALLGGLLAVTGSHTAWADSQTGEQPLPTIAIIIDDMGHDRFQGERLIALDQPLTLAFLPYRRHSTALAEAAFVHDKEIMLHAPMANTRQFGLGPGGLNSDMDELTTTTTLRRALQSIPHVSGVNNHMGSQLTQQRRNMDWIMTELVQYPLYFVDSRTIATTVAEASARSHKVPSLSRDVFLDHEQTQAYVDRQFQKLIATARKNGTAIGIGHPHPVTVDYLEKHLPELDEKGIAVATISALWAIRNNNALMFTRGDRRPVSPALAEKKQ